VAIYHLNVQIISRGSGRSAVGASAYRAGEKLRSNAVNSAAYRSGDELHEGEIVHDYTKRNGVMYKEIMLPNGAPPQYKDRETLWNAVEKREKRHDAQLAREINVALPTEFDLEEQKELLREYIKENFVDKGMIADVAIHHTRRENPHAHIMLTTRHVTPEGFGNKNREWNSSQILAEWREDWADKTNRMLERKGLEIRIDHRSYKEQGIDREPTIHMGAEATALERRGIRTERGDINREIQRRNAERAVNLNLPAEGVASGVRNQNLEFAHTRAALNAAKQRLLTEQRKTTKTAQGMKKQEQNESAQDAKNLEEQLKAEKAEQIVEKMREQQKARDLAEIKPRMDKIEDDFYKSEKEARTLKDDCINIRRDIPPIEYRIENIDEHTQNIRIKQEKIKPIQQERQKAHWWEWEKKSILDGRIRIAEIDLENTRKHFTKKFNIEPEQAQAEIERLQKIIRKKELELAQKEARINKIYDRQDVLREEYQALKLRKELHVDRELVRAHAEYWQKEIARHNREAQAARDRQIWEEIEHRLNTISDKDFQKAIKRLPYEEAQTLAEMREMLREQERLNELERERTQSIGRSR